MMSPLEIMPFDEPTIDEPVELLRALRGELRASALGPEDDEVGFRALVDSPPEVLSRAWSATQSPPRRPARKRLGARRRNAGPRS